MKIGNKLISNEAPIFIIAEIGVNHNGSMELAEKLIQKAKNAGADAVKFQSFKADNLVSEQGELADYQKKAGFKNQKDMLAQYQLTKEEFIRLKKVCEQYNITFLSTPFDNESAHELDSIGVDAFKVGSGDLTHFPLLEQLASYGKPLIISTGMATIDQIKRAVEFLPDDAEISLLHCTSAYPAPYEELHLNAIKVFRENFNCIIGYSDHSMGLEIPWAVTSLGYKILEKHFTLDREMDGPDHKASLTPDEFSDMVKGIRNIEKALGKELKQITPAEINTKKVVRRGIYANKALRKGHIITKEDLYYLRPVQGLEACEFKEIVGRNLLRPKQKGEPVTWKDFDLDGPRSRKT
ncbi:N-acetylneuraminate synthase family protein [Thalassobacillus pellis]|uniref:N-acetylneuraminate synthase family protein n=1 Tax=Thalassobacillus pellis TaxID=748008 RepID=UPI001EF96FDA|nr:N-acetylneuraminate synthase family protein [Thalassobacillus pellis]MBM7552589.1 N-acetylneuraminate synthase/N,N'-diacetyllegionaminate synthase [Thalassobacillus pellis]